MKILSLITLPLEDPVVIFTLVLLIILLSPIVFRKLRIPSIIGLLLAGVVIGPNGLNILLRDSSIILFGTVGLLYIMFMAALEIDMGHFKKNSYKSGVFGLFTFLIPLSLGFVVCHYLLDFSITASFLIASMFSTHTLISYPIVSNLGISKDESVTVTVGGTIITDTAVLMMLAVIVGSTKGSLDMIFWIRMIVSLIVFAVIILYGYPALARWFFRNMPEIGPNQYVFVLALVFIAGILAELAGLEPIIGAFLAGLAVNRLIPSNSVLMNRIEFVGNAIFIPFFLISVGMLVDLRVVFQGPQALIVASSMTIVAIFSKWIAAFLTQKIFRYNSLQRKIIFGLSSSHAAATLAVILIGYELGIIDDNVLNGTIILILITCLASSFVTEHSGRKLAIESTLQKPPEVSRVERILVPVANPKNVSRLIELAIYIKDLTSAEPIYPLSVIKDSEEAEAQLQDANKQLTESVAFARDVNANIMPVTRVDLNVSNGINRAIRELFITTVILGWNAKITTRQWIFGSILDQLLERMNQMIMVCKILEPLNTFRQIVVIYTKAAQYELGFPESIAALKRLAFQIGTTIKIIAHEEDVNFIVNSYSKQSPYIQLNSESFTNFPDLRNISNTAKTSNLCVFMSARKLTISYERFLDEMPYLLSKYFEKYSFIVVYPRQSPRSSTQSSLQLDEYSVFPYHENLTRISRIVRGVKRLFGLKK